MPKRKTRKRTIRSEGWIHGNDTCMVVQVPNGNGGGKAKVGRPKRKRKK